MESIIELIAITSSMAKVKPKNQSMAFKTYYKEACNKLDSYMKPEYNDRIAEIIKKHNNNC